MNIENIKFRVYNGWGMHDHREAMRMLYNQACSDFFDYSKVKFMQFTGFQDVKGKDIYEGDKDALGNVVEWLNGCFCLNGDRPLSWLVDSFEVVGNIYEPSKVET